MDSRKPKNMRLGGFELPFIKMGVLRCTSLLMGSRKPKNQKKFLMIQWQDLFNHTTPRYHWTTCSFVSTYRILSFLSIFVILYWIFLILNELKWDKFQLQNVKSCRALQCWYRKCLHMRLFENFKILNLIMCKFNINNWDSR